MEGKPDVMEDRTTHEDIEVPDLPDENPVITGDVPLVTDGELSVADETLPAGGGDKEISSESVETPKSDQPPDLSAPERSQPDQSRSRATEAQVQEYEHASNMYAELKTAKEEIESKLKRVQETMSRLAHIVLPPIDPNENQRVIIRYIERQKQIRVDRMIRRNAVLQGLKLHDILPGKGSRLDESMARKRGFGLKRPSYPAK